MGGETGPGPNGLCGPCETCSRSNARTCMVCGVTRTVAMDEFSDKLRCHPSCVVFGLCFVCAHNLGKDLDWWIDLCETNDLSFNDRKNLIQPMQFEKLVTACPTCSLSSEKMKSRVCRGCNRKPTNFFSHISGQVADGHFCVAYGFCSNCCWKYFDVSLADWISRWSSDSGMSCYKRRHLVEERIEKYLVAERIENNRSDLVGMVLVGVTLTVFAGYVAYNIGEEIYCWAKMRRIVLNRIHKM